MTDEKEPTILVIDTDKLPLESTPSFSAASILSKASGIKVSNLPKGINPLMPGPVPVKIYSRLNYIPAYATSGSSGVDVRADIEAPITIEPDMQAIIPTGIHMSIPEGTEIQARGRSGLAFKHAIAITHGVGSCDSDYRGEIKCILINHGQEPFTVNPGDRVMQLMLCPVYKMDFIQVDSIDDLDETGRGHGGFGSTGHN